MTNEVTNEVHYYSRDTKVTVQCCVRDCEETVTKSLRNLFTSKNFGCKAHSGKLPGQKSRKQKVI